MQTENPLGPVTAPAEPDPVICSECGCNSYTPVPPDKQAIRLLRATLDACNAKPRFRIDAHGIKDSYALARAIEEYLRGHGLS